MAFLTRTDGSIVRTQQKIQSILDPLGVRLEVWPIPEDPSLRSLLGISAPDPIQGEAILDAFVDRFRLLRISLGYQSRDLIALYPDLTGLDAMVERFVSCHSHADDEVRYVIDGSGVFGFVLPDNDQVELTMVPGDYIHVPAGAEHWFHLTGLRRIKAIRYFTSREGWVPNYTGRQILIFRYTTNARPSVGRS